MGQARSDDVGPPQAASPRPIAVLMVCGAYHPEVSGGAVQCRTLVRALRGRVRFTIFTTTRDPRLPAQDVVDGVPVHRVLVDPVRQPTSKALALPRFLRLFLRRLEEIDIVHLHGFSQKTGLFLSLARLSGRPTLIKMSSVGGDDPLALGRGFWGWLRLALLARVDRVVSVSPALTDRYMLAGFPHDRLAVIPNGVDVDRFRPPADAEEVRSLRVALGLPQDRPVVSFIGHFSREKGVLDLVRAWRRLRGEGLRCCLVLIGATEAGTYEVDEGVVAGVRAEVEALEAADEVRFVEKTLEVERFLRASDCFVLPSVREGLPNALLEGMASGIACLSSRLPGVTDWVVRDGVNGLLCRPGDVEDLARGLSQLLTDPDRRRAIGRAARRHVENGFAIGRVADQYFALYADMRGGRLRR